MRTFARRALVLSFLSCCPLAGCGRKPAPRAAPGVVIEIAKGGSLTADGEELAKERLSALLKKEAAGAVRDVEDIGDLPVIAVTISAHPECAYSHVQDVMVQCMRAYITNVSWEMGGKRRDASLVRYDVIEPMEVEMTREEAEKLLETEAMTREEAEKFLETFPRKEGAGDRVGAANRSVPPGEIRVRLYWANAKGEARHGPDRPPPGGGFGGAPSMEGMHVAIRINDTPCTDLDEFVRRLRKLVFEMDHPPVVIDAWQMVPFKRVFRVVEACGAAGAGKLRYQAPPVEGEGGSDWWWM